MFGAGHFYKTSLLRQIVCNVHDCDRPDSTTMSESVTYDSLYRVR
jgi:hypothetical protein